MSAWYVASPSTMTYTSASTSANIRRTTLPLPRGVTKWTVAPWARAMPDVSSVELLSKTWISASGSDAANPSITSAIAAASL